MKVTIPYEVYKGTADGSSLTEDRRRQILTVYQYVMSRGDEIMTYRALQEAMDAQNVGISKSAIRTFFPILNKLGFVSYKDTFAANELFTKVGKVYMETYLSLKEAEKLCPQNELLNKEIESCLATIQRYGILLMNDKEEFHDHGIWLAIGLLKYESEIFWNEFLYFMYLLRVKNHSLKEAIEIVRGNRFKGIEYNYYNKDGQSIAGTSYSYTHALLLEAGIISDMEVSHSVLNEGMSNFLETIINHYE